MISEHNNDWYKIDNVAKVFLASYDMRDTRSIRVSATLKETVDPELLQSATEKMAQLRPQFQVRIRRGFFWHYMEQTDEKPVVKEDSGRPCPLLYGPSFHGVLHYQVSYFGKRINIDMFHALSDGTGALALLELLLQIYLKMAHPDMENISVGGTATAADRVRNSYEQFYYNEGNKLPQTILNKKKKAYRISGRHLPYNQLQFFEIHMSAATLRAKSKEIGSGMTAYLGAQLMMAIHEDMPAMQKSKPITITMPVNLRNYYPSETLRNFFNNVDVTHVFDGTETLESLAATFDEQLKVQLQPQRIQDQMNRYESMERFLFTRVVPLAIKQPVIRMFSKKESKSVTAVLSNLGRINMHEELIPYVEGISDFCSTDKLFITVTSFGDDLCFGVANAFTSTSVLRNMIGRLQADGADVTLYATEVVR